MKKLKMPFEIDDTLNIYRECVNMFTSEEEKDILRTYEQQIDLVSKEYDKYMPEEFDKFVHPITSDIEKKYLKKVYENKFVGERCNGYYDKIKSNANLICPFCGEGTPKNLDHFLPKAEYPFLVVTPANLIPSCRDCNMEKNVATPNSNEEVPLHPYYDDIKLTWLEVNIDFSQKNTLKFNFKNCLSYESEPILSKRIDIHMKVHGLKANFESRSTSEINARKRNHFVSAKSGKKFLRKEIELEKESCESEDINSWRSALYRELLKNCDAYFEWLKMLDCNI